MLYLSYELGKLGKVAARTSPRYSPETSFSKMASPGFTLSASKSL